MNTSYKHNITLLFLILASLPAFSQFRMIGTASWTVVTDSTYSGTINFQVDLTGKGYLATSVVDTFRVFTGTEQIYTITTVGTKTFSSAQVTIKEYNGDHGIPIGQVMVYDPAGKTTLPQAPFGSTGSTAQLQAAIDTYNARLLSSISSLADGDKGDITVSASGASWTIDNNAITGDKISASAVGADEIASGAVGPDELAATSVTPGVYTAANLTIDQDGRIESATDGETLYNGGTFSLGSTHELLETALGAYSTRFRNSAGGYMGIYSDATDGDFLGLKWVTLRGTFEMGETLSEFRMKFANDTRFELSNSLDRFYFEGTYDTDDTNTAALAVDPVTFELEKVSIVTPEMLADSLSAFTPVSALSDLTDVNTSTPTNRNVLVADGVDWESRPLVEADISDLQSYLTTALTSLNGLTGSTQTFATSTAGPIGWSSSGTTHTLLLPNATTSVRGVVSTTAQSFAGEKTFDADITRLLASSLPPELILKHDLATLWTANEKTAFGVEDNELGSITSQDFSGSVHGGLKLKGSNRSATSSQIIGIQYEANVSNEPTTYAAHYFDVRKHGGSGTITNIAAAANLAMFTNEDNPVITIKGNGDFISTGSITSTTNMNVGANLLLLNGGIVDENVSLGSTGEVLSKTATGVDWVDPNAAISSAQQYAQSHIAGGENTSITAGTPEQVNATTTGTVTTIVNTSEFTVQADGDLQYTGANNSVLELSVDISVSNGGASSMYYYIAINGTVQATSRVRNDAPDAAAYTFSINWIDSDADTNDVYSVYAEPVTGTELTTVTDMRIKARKIK